MAGQRCEFGQGRALREALDSEIRGVDPKQESRAFADGCRIVADPRSVGGADFAEVGSRLHQDIWHAEAASDFHQLAPRHDDLASVRK